MGDTNEINLGDGASAKQVVAGQNNTLWNIEQQNNFYGAFPQDARLLSITPPRDFTGREREIETLAVQLTQGRGAALVGIAGMAGVGKSALARAVAQRVAAQFPGGCVWVKLRGTDQTPTLPADAMRQVILALEPQLDFPSQAEDLIVQGYRRALASKRVLIVLDDAADNAQLRPLLEVEAAFLVTARSRLTESGLAPLRLDVLDAADARGYLQKRVPRLRAQEADAVTEACGYLPLALSIAGGFLAKLPNFSPADYLTQLGARRLDLLKERNDPGSNVEAAFEITYNQLPPELQVLWRVLGIFPAAFGGAAAKSVWGVEDEARAQVALGELWRVSLIDYDLDGQRYHLHDLLGEFARRRLTQDERATADKRHAEYFNTLARQVDALYLRGGENVVIAMRLFEQELVHLRVAQKWSAAHCETDGDAARLCSQFPYVVAHVMDMRMHVTEQIRWLEDAVKASRILGDRQAETNALGSLGNAYTQMGEMRRAVEYYEQVLDAARELGDRRSQANSLGNLGSAYIGFGEVPRAIDYLKEDLEIRRELEDTRGEGEVYGILGNAYAALGETRVAIGNYDLQLAIAEKLGDSRGKTRALGNLGSAYTALGEARTAIDLHERQLDIAREINDRRAQGSALNNLGLAYLALGEPQTAIGFIEQNLDIMREIDDRNGTAAALGNLGNACRIGNDVTSAIEYYTRALEIERQLDNRRGEGNALGNLGAAYAELDDRETALVYLEQALEIRTELHDRQGQANDLANMGDVFRALGDTARAKPLIEQALEIYVAIEDPNANLMREWLERLNAAELRAQAAKENEDPPDEYLVKTKIAIEYFEQLLTDARATGNRRSQSNALAGLGDAYRRLGETQTAVGYYQAQLENARAMGEREDEVRALGSLADASMELGEMQRAIEYFEPYLDLAREAGDRGAERYALANMGNAYLALKERDKALECLTQNLVIARELDDGFAEASGLIGLGNAYLDLEDLPAALDSFQQALAVATESGYVPGEYEARFVIGNVYTDLKEPRNAIPFYEKAAEQAHDMGHWHGETSVYGNLGLAYAALDEYDTAIEFFDKALMLARQFGYRHAEGMALADIGDAYNSKGDTEHAREYWQKGLDIFEEMESPYAEEVKKLLGETK